MKEKILSLLKSKDKSSQELGLLLMEQNDVDLPDFFEEIEKEYINLMGFDSTQITQDEEVFDDGIYKFNIKFNSGLTKKELLTFYHCNSLEKQILRWFDDK